MIPATSVAKLQNALPFWMSLGLIPLSLLGAAQGGWYLILVPLYALVLTSLLDWLTGLNLENADTETPEPGLHWYRLITLIWFPLQIVMQFGLIWYATQADHLATWEKLALFYGVGVMSGGIGINYAHELMHQKNALERWLGDLLMAAVLYGHFRSEHLLVHHRYVGTPRDPVTAHYNEGFHRFFPRVLRQCLTSAWAAEAAMLARKGLGPFHASNPFWRYAALQGAMLLAALLIGGLPGLGLFLFQALIAVWYLELTNYVEHYGLTRKYLGDGSYEPVRPHHSWNADHRMTSWQFINLQRHSDHHTKPARRYPLLQTYPEAQAPQLPFGYTAMGFVAMVPPVWRRLMNPKVRKWRADHYPEITDWGPYKTGQHPVPVIR